MTPPVTPPRAQAPRQPATLDALPVPADFRGELQAARALGDPATRLERLAQLANHRLGFLETIQLDRALAEAASADPGGLARVSVALLSASTVDHLVPAARVAGLRRRLLLDVRLGQYGQYRQELLDARSALHRAPPQLVVLSLHARDLLATLPLGAGAAEVEGAIDRHLEELRALWRRAREALGASVIQQTFLNWAEPAFGGYDRAVPAAPARVIGRLNDRLAEFAAADGVALLDVARASERDGLDAWFDRARWLQAKQEVAPPAAPAWGELLGRVVGAQRGLSRKCLVLDLDNTLWGGVIGDDGLEGIVLGEGSARGEAHLALQRWAKQMRDRGVILAVCSKNDPAIAEQAFREHPEMALRRDDVAVFLANWEDKAANLQRIATMLNIGLDSLVFVDDNPAERARIRGSLPMVAVPELPDDAGEYVARVAGAGYFEAVTFTAEDRERAEQYAANAAREVLLQSAESMDDFLRGLEMQVAFGPFRPVDLPRVTQLINKTNQFNTTTRRHSAEAVARFAADPATVTLQFRLADKCGDNGLVSVMILVPDGEAPGTLLVDTWVMSCRVFGRQLEHEAMNLAVEAARAAGAARLRAEYRPTPKNGVVRELYPSLGFRPGPAAPDGATAWELDLAGYVPHATHIRRSPD